MLNEQKLLQLAASLICSGRQCPECQRMLGVCVCPGPVDDGTKLEFAKAIIAKMREIEARQPLITEEDILKVIGDVVNDT